MKKTLFFLSLLIVFVFSMVYNGFGKVDHVQVSIEESTAFSKEEINEAVVAVKKKFKDFIGCTLTHIWYIEDKSMKITDDYMKYGNGSVNGVQQENVIVLLSSFKVGSSGGDGSLEPHSTYTDWNWIVVRDDHSDKWRVDDWGY
ncbi:DUF4829 domain-containing protein [Bacillus weihaiensis]|uniref:DUF4829 domain-containing protein n=1 Tax=Bacillus weihaiensis TaxID=1547283 RepID=A0A1L3MW04_9BACI|nr:DUF4829 domain-containing protein [Bacillus weihaiensis]APH06514.1 DUF4829 domain-containing protein [Bacillus weihaiensis]